MQPQSVEPARLVVLVSGSGSNLGALLEACAEPVYGARVVAVGADRGGILGLRRAEDARVPAFVESLRGHPDRDSWDAALAQRIAGFGPDLVVSAGFMKILGPRVVDAFAGRIVNTHPALLPSFPGAHAVRDALAHGVQVTGATCHLVDAGVDTGPIVDQIAVRVEPGDDEAVLHERIKEAERGMLVRAVGALAREGYRLDGRRVLLGGSSGPPG